MLILGRLKEQWVEIGDRPNSVVVKVLKVRADGTVKLGIQAPKSVPIRRGPELTGPLEEVPE